MRRTRLAVLVALALPALAAGCGGDDDASDQDGKAASSPQGCIDRWNSKANERHQASLAGAVSAGVLPPDAFRVGTWPKSERTVPVHSPKAFLASPDGRAVVPKGSCLIITPAPEGEDEATFFEDQGKWQYARERTRFPAEARRSVADAETAIADGLGKLKLK